MSRLIGVSLAVLVGVLAASPATAFAQQGGYPYGPPRAPAYGPGYRPGLSPYLNITRGGGDPAVNYFLGTIPEFQRRANAQMFSSQIAELETRPPAVAGAATDADLFNPLPSTGHLTAFQNTAGYYPGRPRLAGGPGTARPTNIPAAPVMKNENK